MFIVEAEPENDSVIFRRPQDFNSEEPQPSTTNSIESENDVDSTSSSSNSVPRRGTRKRPKPKPTKRSKNIGGASNFDEDEQLEEAMRMSLEQSMLEEEIRRKENEAISKAINESMSIVSEDVNCPATSIGSTSLPSTNDIALASVDGLSSTIEINRDKKNKKPGKKEIFNEVINMRDSECDTSTIDNVSSGAKKEIPNSKYASRKNQIDEDSSDESEEEISSTKRKTSLDKKRAKRKTTKPNVYYESDSSDYQSCEDTTLDETPRNDSIENSVVLAEEKGMTANGFSGEHEMHKEFRRAENHMRKILRTRLLEGIVFFLFPPLFANNVNFHFLA